MSEPFTFSRRDFLKLVGIGAAGAAAGCGAPRSEKLIPYLISHNDVLPGVPVWYATACRECPAGCGMLVKTREGRAVKVEGNPAHPIGRGALCARGQSSLQGLYDPDRIAAPMQKVAGAWKQITWADAEKLLATKLGEAAAGKRGVVFLTGNDTGSFEQLVDDWCAAVGAQHLVYEPFAHEGLREANRQSFGLAQVPEYDFARARYLLSLGADFLETWLSPVAHASAFRAMHGVGAGGLRTFVAAEPRLSLTAANADEWLAIRPGSEGALALGLAHVIVKERLGAKPADAALAAALAAYSPQATEAATDIAAATVERVAREFASNRPSLAVAGGVAGQSTQATATLVAVNLLNLVAGNAGETVRFERALNYDRVGSFRDVQALVQRMAAGRVDVALVRGANPVYSVPAAAGFGPAFSKVLFKVSFSPTLDETAAACDLVLPDLSALESFGDAHSARGVYSLMQPVMKPLPMFQSKATGDVLLSVARQMGGTPAARLKSPTWLDYLREQWLPLHRRLGAGEDFETFWNAALAKGGLWEEPALQPIRWVGKVPALQAAAFSGAGDLHLTVYPSMGLYDGRGANKSWLQELPDPTIKATWDSWVEMHPDTAKRLGVGQGDVVKMDCEGRTVQVPVVLYAGLRKDTVAIPLGQGHSAYGRYAAARGVNALDLLPATTDAASGALAYLSAKVAASRTGATRRLAITQRDRRIHQEPFDPAEVIPIAALAATGAAASGAVGGGAGAAGVGAAGGATTGAAAGVGAAAGAGAPLHAHKGIDRTLPAHAVSAFVPEHEVAGPRNTPTRAGEYGKAKHRWAMAIDLSSCTGCSACVVACRAENNVPTVGPERVFRGREMDWLRIERYESFEGGKHDVRFLPMLCQHCTMAPCEVVCPVYATYHNPEGLNAQVYNRCIGTRYCSNNCPYKVRAFNWFDYSDPNGALYAFPEPLNWQLNPDVTVRSRGVMEKCTFCFQRILEAKGKAKDEQREVRDGDIVTACQQSCPTEAIVFGDLMDPNSRVSQLSEDDRRYWVLGDLNTKPGITYLKKVQRENA